eukprot:Blabericola_migrator_1__5542@NODE_2822_length_2317_cov_194_057778_g1770_i0_p2_GENE_NODE_2822_length_2317_cov_194_057778_g1770_i0NODE_2822_length_2317_cov_194_057778_g1770_i0_p2_ORF_typecomplete_len123_score7_17zfRING_2/PF13639_6/3_9e14ProkRING_4/PF14447_6/2_8e07zfRING_5/PF14634_6/3_9e06zfrbx1/PF12678_7/1_3e05zfrbx1/PF12678_7/4e03zfC3HC4_2/PF13923_6/5_8e06zfC3HC4_3/PF13920_6/9_3e06zfC3HC4/PF00097_25/1_4e05zfRINGlike/PF08746_11/2_3e05zfRING_11/PF17123_5/4_2e05zfRING_11/PF17123_5/5_3e03Zn_ribbon_17
MKSWKDQLPTYRHSGNPSDCSICTEEICIGQTCRALPCLHFFHEYCLDQWLHRSYTCPYCRYDTRKLLRDQEHLESRRINDETQAARRWRELWIFCVMILGTVISSVVGVCLGLYAGAKSRS